VKIGHHVLPGAVTGGRDRWPRPVAATGRRDRWPRPVAATGGRAGWPRPVTATGGRAGWPLPVPVSATTPLTGCSTAAARRKRPRAETAHRANE